MPLPGGAPTAAVVLRDDGGRPGAAALRSAVVAGPDRASHPEIAVVCSTYRRPARLRRLVAALEHQTLEPSRFEVVLVDNASGDSTAAVIAEVARTSSVTIRALATTSNHGPAPARNRGWRASPAPLLAFIDDDVEPAPDWLRAGLDALRGDPLLGIVQGCVVPPPGPLDRLIPWTLVHRVDGPDPYFPACNLFLRRDALEETGGFDETIGWWGEDTALGWAVVAAGWGRAFAADALAVHPMELRPVSWYVRNGWNDRALVGLAKAHPGFRAEAFWRPWAKRRREALLALALVSSLASLRWPLAAAGVLPYLRDAQPPVGRPGWVRLGAETVLVDAARLAGSLAGSAQHRMVVL